MKNLHYVIKVGQSSVRTEIIMKF